MTDVILVPWRGRDPERERNLKFVLGWYAPLGLPVFYGDSGHTPFNRGASRNAAADAAGDWDAALIIDADCVADLAVIRAAFTEAKETGKLIVPHDVFWATNRNGVEYLLGDPGFYRDNPKRIQKLCPWPVLDMRVAPSGALVVTRESFEKIGRYAEDYVGWGYEDSAFLEDARLAVGYTRRAGYLWHLWHRPDRGTMASRRANEDLMKLHSRKASE